MTNTRGEKGIEGWVWESLPEKKRRSGGDRIRSRTKYVIHCCLRIAGKNEKGGGYPVMRTMYRLWSTEVEMESSRSNGCGGVWGDTKGMGAQIAQ